MAGVEGEPSVNRRRLTIVTLCIIGTGSYASLAVPILSEALQQAFGLTEGRLGLLMSSGMVGGVAGGLLGGLAADRYGRLRSMQVLTVIAALGCLGCAHAVGAKSLSTALAITGFGYAGALTAGAGLLSALHPSRRRGSYSGVLVTHACAGMALPPIISTLKRSYEGGSLALHWVLGAPFVVVAACLLALTLIASKAREPEADPADEAASPASPALAGPAAGIGLFVLLAALHGTADTTLYNWMPKFLGSAFEHQAFEPGLVLSLYSAVYLVGRLALTFLPDAFAPRALLIIPGIVGGSLALLAAQAPGFGWAAGAYVAASAFYGLEYPALMGMAARRYPRRFSTLCGLVSAANLISAAGVVGVGRWTEITGSMRPGLSVASMGFVAFGIIAAIWLRRSNRGGTGVLSSVAPPQE